MTGWIGWFTWEGRSKPLPIPKPLNGKAFSPTHVLIRKNELPLACEITEGPKMMQGLERGKEPFVRIRWVSKFGEWKASWTVQELLKAGRILYEL